MGDQGTLDAGSENLGERRRPLCQRLRIGTSCLCLAMCVVFVAFWVHSYYSYGSMQGVLPAKRVFSVVSKPGQITLYGINTSGRGARPWQVAWQYRFMPADRYQEMMDKELGREWTHAHAFFGFSLLTRSGIWRVSVPHWFPVIVTGALAVLLKSKPRFRIGLRGLFAVVTLVAVVLGAVEALVGISD